ncbi:hypothetical protein [Asticcacaulis sp. AND118]|uniref:TolB family protein n=1 Tax=Asticcacaulis sp. AND118 TaxID=2840468 RepID=UPI001CFF8984|nr:hypothetical protein [Asticcacaulis sp. AND118]UDF02384.1 hypothetical protein LH365_07985 [Asticcacaulis sp. AND118]
MSLRSSIEIYDLETRQSRVVWQGPELWESPHFTPDGQTLILNSEGRIYRLPVGGEPQVIDTGFAIRCNNDHGLTPDGQTLLITDKVEYDRACIYALPLAGGVPKRLSAHLAAYYHGCSPDGAWITYAGIHQKDVFGIYLSRLDGSDERALIVGDGVHDGPDFSADGEWLWFNSNRSGQMQVWRIRRDGSDLQRMTDSPYADWFPHPSPDGRHVLLLSYDPSVGRDHPRDQTVRLRLMPAEGGEPETLFEMFGGQGTMNVPNWAPGGRSFAFVRYF